MESNVDATSPRSCPSENGILALAAGRHSPDKRAQVIAHVETCDACRFIVGEASRAMTSAARPALGTFAAGARLLERYEITRRIGSGGMGEVYAATDLLLKEEVACKTLICSSLDDERAAQRLRAEVQLARRVSHPNVCRILEFGLCKNVGEGGVPDDVPFFTMELLSGQPLSKVLATRGPFSVEDARPLVRQMLDGLSAIHGQGIVHRDFKSDNIFLVEGERGPRVVITDFGLAFAIDLSRSLGGSADKIIGTLDYMAPEQLVGAKPTPAFDLYALGVVLFELLTGQRPFAHENPLAGALQRFNRNAPPLSSILPGADANWERVIRRCLARDPQERYATVDDIRAALFEAAPTPRRSSRRRLAVMGALSAVGVGAMSLFALRGPEATRTLPAVVLPATAAAAPRPPSPPPESPRVAEAPRSPETLARQPSRPAPKHRPAPSAKPSTTTQAAESPLADAPLRSRRDPIYTPRFDVKPAAPSLGANGLPNPFSSNQ